MKVYFIWNGIFMPYLHTLKKFDSFSIDMNLWFKCWVLYSLVFKLFSFPYFFLGFISFCLGFRLIISHLCIRHSGLTSLFFLLCFWDLQEIVSIYPVLSPPNLTPGQSNRVCNALALLQVIHSLLLYVLNTENEYRSFMSRANTPFVICCSVWPRIQRQERCSSMVIFALLLMSIKWCLLFFSPFSLIFFGGEG